MPASNFLASHVHKGSVAAVVELHCAHESMLSTPQLRELGEAIAMHIVAMNPRYVSREAIDGATLHQEQLIASQSFGTGALESFFRNACLLEQSFVLGPSETVGARVEAVATALGGQIQVVRFWRHVASAT